jgi:hypothetical protein
VGNIILGKGSGKNAVLLGYNGRRKVWLDFSYPIFCALIGRKRSFKSSLVRVLVKGLLEKEHIISNGFLPKPILFDPLGNLSFDKPNPDTSDLPPRSYKNIKTLSLREESLRIPFSTLTADDLCDCLAIHQKCILQKRIVRMVLNIVGQDRTKEAFVSLARTYAFKLPQISQEGFETKIDALECDQMICDEVFQPLDWLNEYDGLRLDLSSLLPEDQERANFVIRYILKQVVTLRSQARNEEILYALGEDAKAIMPPVCVIADELTKMNCKSFFDLIRISGNLGISVVLASQSLKDYENPIVGQRDVTFCGKLVTLQEIRQIGKMKMSNSNDLQNEIPQIKERTCIAWNEHNSIFTRLKLRESSTLHYGRDENVDNFKTLYQAERNITKYPLKGAKK